MVQVVWAEPAAADLESIYRFIARNSPHYARLTVEELLRAAELLQEFPEMGELLPEVSHRSYRQLAVGAYRLIYRLDAPTDRVLVMAAIHAARRLPPLVEPP